MFTRKQLPLLIKIKLEYKHLISYLKGLTKRLFTKSFYTRKFRLLQIKLNEIKWKRNQSELSKAYFESYNLKKADLAAQRRLRKLRKYGV